LTRSDLKAVTLSHSPVIADTKNFVKPDKKVEPKPEPKKELLKPATPPSALPKTEAIDIKVPTPTGNVNIPNSATKSASPPRAASGSHFARRPAYLKTLARTRDPNIR
jgi:hypothetical protein